MTYGCASQTDRCSGRLEAPKIAAVEPFQQHERVRRLADECQRTSEIQSCEWKLAVNGHHSLQRISAGSMIGTILVALDPAIPAGVFASSPGLVPESVRWQPVRRSVMGNILARRTPSLINAPGLTAIDGVTTAPPHYDENKPLRDQPPVINMLAGAMELQQAFEFAEMVQENGLTPVTWARYLRTTPLPGLYPKSVIYQFAKGDQNATNPGTSALIREGGLEDRTLYYRNDLAFIADPNVPKNPHLFGGMANAPNATFRDVARGARDQMGTFFASGGLTVIHPNPQLFFEVPIAGALPETLNFIP